MMMLDKNSVLSLEGSYVPEEKINAIQELIAGKKSKTRLQECKIICSALIETSDCSFFQSTFIGLADLLPPENCTPHFAHRKYSHLFHLKKGRESWIGQVQNYISEISCIKLSVELVLHILIRPKNTNRILILLNYLEFKMLLM